MVDRVAELVAAEPPLTARSVVLSTLLGTEPPVLPVGMLVRISALFGFGEGTVRTAVTRMVGRAELVAVGGARYRLGDHLRVRQERQAASRSATTVPWSGAWTMAVTEPGPRSQAARRRLRADLAALRLAPLRDGVHLRPDNLPSGRLAEARARVDAAATWFVVQPDGDDELAARLWDLGAWIVRAEELRRALGPLTGWLGDDRTDVLAAGFVVSAATLRHLQADPLLPRELWPRRWNGERLRADYERFDEAYRRVLREWWGGDPAADGSARPTPGRVRD